MEHEEVVKRQAARCAWEGGRGRGGS
jgi:hypothetical protein